jgi:serine protease SohB
LLRGDWRLKWRDMRRYIPFVKSPPVVSVIRLQGIIAAQARGGALNDAALAGLLQKAFSKGKPVAVALSINSPGGSPSQSSLISARIRRLAEEKNVKVYAFVEDVAASGGYYIASAADEIWVDRHSIVGSIGVISAGFGFSELIEKYGVERRVYTAGKSKSMLDPFRPENPEDIARLKMLQEHIHEEFIDHVRTRRGDRLNNEMELFNGDIWVGSKALETGLIDGVGHLVPRMKEIFGDKVLLRPYRQPRTILGRFGAQMTGDAMSEVEDRAAFARFGV